MRRGLAGSREQGRRLIESGAVLVNGALADKSARMVSAAEPIVVQANASRFVSRAGEKLDAALERFALTVFGRRCLDAGASTGGFTDCLLQRGAAHVVAVDVGYGQLHPGLRHSGAVTVLERTNIRHLSLDDVGGVPFDVVVADLSFISLTSVAVHLAGPLATPGADVVVLVKPQFEAGRDAARRARGVIRDPGVRLQALERAASALMGAGATIMGAMASPLLGPAGNAEFLLHARAHRFAPAAVASSDPTAARSTGPAAGPDTTLTAMLEAAVSESPDGTS